jgi:RNA polymerase Rpb2, domain 6
VITIDQMIDLHLYKNQRIAFSNFEQQAAKKRSGTIVFNMSDKKEDLVKLLNSNLLFNQYVRNMYVPSIYRSKFDGKLIHSIQQQYYKDLRAMGAKTLVGRPTIKNDTNIFYDMSFELSSFFAHDLSSPRKRLLHFKTLIHDIFNSPELNGYTEKIAMIPVDDSVVNFDEQDDTKVIPLMILRLITLKMIQPEDFKGVTLVFYNSERKVIFKLNPTSDITSLSRLRNNVKLLHSLSSKDLTDAQKEQQLSNATSDQPADPTSQGDDAKEKMIEVKDNVVKTLMDNLHINPSIHNLTGDEMEIADKLDQIVENDIEKNPDGEASEEEVLKQLEDNEELKSYLNTVKEDRLTGKRKELADKRNKDLRDRQNQVSLGDIPLKDIFNEFKAKAIDIEEIPVQTIHDQIKTSKLKDFDYSYNALQKDKDTAAIISHFSYDPDLPVFVRSVTKENTSDEFNKKETLTVNFEDGNGVKHTFRIDIPIIIDGKFMYLNGGKKTLTKQITRLPVSKIKSDTVEVTSNYNKLLVRRYGQNVSTMVSRFEKWVKGNLDHYPKTKLQVFLGDNSLANQGHQNTLDYDQVSSFVMGMNIDNYVLNFNRDEIIKAMAAVKIENKDFSIWDADELPFGFSRDGKSVLLQNKDTSRVLLKPLDGSPEILGESLISGILQLLSRKVDATIPSEVAKLTAGSRYVYTRVTIISRKVPMIVMLGYYKGLSEVMRRYGMNYEFSEKRKKFDDPAEAHKWNVIQFNDGFLYYPSEPLRYSLLLNGLTEMSTRDYNFSDFNEEAVYLDFFQRNYGSRNVAKGLYNTMSLLLDPITKDILRDLKLPDDFTDLMLHVNTLLENTNFRMQNDITSYRIRGGEQINAYLYYILANSYRNYRDSVKAGKRDARITAPQNELVKQLLESPMVDEYSVLNPILEAEKMASCTFKGLSGINMDEAYKMEIRSYDPSMVGVLGLNTPDSSKVGVVRQMTYNPKLLNTRGFISTDIQVADMNSSDLFTPAELLSPFTGRHADPPRQGMQVTQAKHIIPTLEQDKPLVGSGIEKTLPHILGSDFVFKAKNDGVVKVIDPKNELMVVQYKDGSTDVVDLSAVQAKNSNGGFFITNQKTTELKQGDKFKKDEILAKNPNFFHGTKDNTSYVTGKLAKVAITGGDFTFEDSSIVTETLSEAMSSYITMNKKVNLGPNANVEKMVKKGQMVTSGDALLIFENSFDEAAANKILDRLGAEFDEAISESSKNIVKSKYTGEVVDIKIYYNRPVEELSDSLQKVVKDYSATIKKRMKAIQTHAGKDANTDHITLPPHEQVNETKIQGEELDGVLIEFYIRYKDELYIGDKITFSVALKSIIADVIKKDETPYSEFKPEEEVSAIISPLSVVARMTQDVIYQMWINKVLIGLKDEVKKIYES